MATLTQKINADLKVRELVEEAGLPAPDDVEYGETCIRAFWHESKVVLVVDIDEDGTLSTRPGAVGALADDDLTRNPP